MISRHDSGDARIKLSASVSGTKSGGPGPLPPRHAALLDRIHTRRVQRTYQRLPNGILEKSDTAGGTPDKLAEPGPVWCRFPAAPRDA
jgi:hypothetical protein